jgi:hypothetical protein
MEIKDILNKKRGKLKNLPLKLKTEKTTLG